MVYSKITPARNPARTGYGRTSFTLDDDQAAKVRELCSLYAAELGISRLLLKDAFLRAFLMERKRLAELGITPEPQPDEPPTDE